MMTPSELMTLFGETDGSATTGDFSLYSDIGYSALTVPFRIPRGMKVKIWAYHIDGEKCEVTVKYTHDATAGSPSYIEVGHFDLSSEGELGEEKRRPIVLRSLTGDEGFKLAWEQSTAAKTHIQVEIEISK